MKRAFAVGVSLSCLAGHAWALTSHRFIQKTLGIPETVATVVDAEGTSPQLILIQDIHRHPESQQNIAALILYGLRHWGAQEILIEGSWGERHDLKKSATRFPSLIEAVRNGQLGGAEMALAMSPEADMRILGLEDSDVYRKNVAAYEAVEKIRARALEELETTRLLTRLIDAEPAPAMRQLQKLIQLRLKPSEYEDYIKNPYRPTTDSMLATAVRTAEQYYDLVNERSRIFLQRAKHFHRSGTQVLVVGGFHTHAMTEELRREGTPFAVLSPRVTQGGYDALYSQGMQNTISALKLR